MGSCRSGGYWCAAVALTASASLISACAPRPARPDADAAEATTTRTTGVLSGYASYYGDGFAGKPTASGEIFDPGEMVAAHRTLPLGTRARVINIENGRSVVVRIIDRGPYAARNTIIDVSEGAARRLGFLKDGRVRVQVEVLTEHRAKRGTR